LTLFTYDLAEIQERAGLLNPDIGPNPDMSTKYWLVTEMAELARPITALLNLHPLPCACGSGSAYQALQIPAFRRSGAQWQSS